MCNIEKEKKKKEWKKIIFICSPYASNSNGDIQLNTERAKRYARFAIIENTIPFVPHLLYPRFLYEDDPQERNLGIEMGLKMLTKCDELWVFGDVISKGMTREINKAVRMKMPIRCFSTECKTMTGDRI